jgi:hypothetical protein
VQIISTTEFAENGAEPIGLGCLIRKQTARFRFSTVYSTVARNFAAKLRNSPQRFEKAELLRYLASATLCNTMKTNAKNLSRIMSPLL